MRPGQKGVLIKIERRGGARFVVRGADSDAEVYGDLDAALQSFEAIERGLARPRERGGHWRIAQRAYDGIRSPGLALWQSLRHPLSGKAA